MLETLRAWLNGKKEYFTGVAIYAQLGDNSKLLEVLKKGATPFTTKRLGEELLAICNQLKEKNNVTPTSTGNGKSPLITNRTFEKTFESKSDVHPRNATLYESCKKEADLAYKKVMNTRAVLFASIHSLEDPNTPEKIKERAKQAIDIVEGFKHVSQLYDDADHVRVHGYLPGTDSGDKETEYDATPNHLVKQSLDNLRKNYNKMKKREATPVRVAMLQQHEKNIAKLEGRWSKLK